MRLLSDTLARDKYSMIPLLPSVRYRGQQSGHASQRRVLHDHDHSIEKGGVHASLFVFAINVAGLT